MVRDRELVGRVWIDHGRLTLCDPIYTALSDRDAEEVASGSDVVHLDFADTDVKGSPDHLGVAVASGFGDGHYPVYIERAEFDGEVFVSRVVVDFLVSDEGAREFDEALAAQSAEGVESVVTDWAES
jgi:hypothetical protein